MEGGRGKGVYTPFPWNLSRFSSWRKEVTGIITVLVSWVVCNLQKRNRFQRDSLYQLDDVLSQLHLLKGFPNISRNFMQCQGVDKKLEGIDILDVNLVSKVWPLWYPMSAKFFLSKTFFIQDILLFNWHFQNFLISVLVSIFLFVLSPCLLCLNPSFWFLDKIFLRKYLFWFIQR